MPNTRRKEAAYSLNFSRKSQIDSYLALKEHHIITQTNTTILNLIQQN